MRNENQYSISFSVLVFKNDWKINYIKANKQKYKQK